jgi:hypothetical protein
MLLGLYKARTDEQIIEEEENEAMARELRRRNRLKG